MAMVGWRLLRWPPTANNQQPTTGLARLVALHGLRLPG